MPALDSPPPYLIGQIQPQFSHRYIDRNLGMWHCVPQFNTPTTKDIEQYRDRTTE